MRPATLTRPVTGLVALLGLRLLLSLPICLLQLAILLAIAPNGQIAVAGALVASMAFLGAASSLTAAFQLRVRNDLSMLVVTVQSVLWTGGAVIVASFTSDIRAFAVVFVISNVVSSALTVYLVLKRTKVHVLSGRRMWGYMLRVGVVLGAAGILVTLYVRIDQILVFEFAGSRQAGLYGAAYRVLDQAQFVPGSVMATLFPLIASAYPVDLARVRHLLQVSAEYLAMGSFGALAFIIATAREVMVLLFGQAFAPAAPALPVLMGAFVSISFGYLAGNMVVILNLQRRYLAYAALGVVLNVVLNVLLIPPYGFQAAAWITLLTEVFVMSLTMRKVLTGLQMRPSWLRMARIGLAAAVMGLGIAVLEHLGVPLSGLVALAAVGYVALLFGLGALTRRDVSTLLRREQPV